MTAYILLVMYIAGLLVMYIAGLLANVCTHIMITLDHLAGQTCAQGSHGVNHNWAICLEWIRVRTDT